MGRHASHADAPVHALLWLLTSTDSALPARLGGPTGGDACGGIGNDALAGTQTAEDGDQALGQTRFRISAPDIESNTVNVHEIENDISSVLFVDAKATGAETGTSWADAFTDLQDALTVIIGAPGYAEEIWVAAGTYTPDPSGLVDPREASFQLINGVAIYGGFTGTETSREQRNWETHETIHRRYCHFCISNRLFQPVHHTTGSGPVGGRAPLVERRAGKRTPSCIRDRRLRPGLEAIRPSRRQTGGLRHGWDASL